MDDITGLIARELVHSSLDLRSGFQKIPLSPGDKYKTALSTHAGSAQFTVLAMKLCGRPATSQSAMRTTLRGLQSSEIGLLYIFKWV
uniref:Reverse transcriptase domain-containing protein n=1 Tax=Heterorhabditis bacteriophora TaxID=37862 RepID=A0A1I7W6G3_HETBA